MLRAGSITLTAILATGLTMGSLGAPPAIAGESADTAPTATLDGKPIPLADVSKYHCDDFSYPEIRCSTSALVTTTRATLLSLLADIEYVTVYEFAMYGGASMIVSQDYSMLALIGWNDRISSFKGRNMETGRFWVDWFYSGNGWNICCNGQVPSLGSFDNTFSSVERT